MIGLNRNFNPIVKSYPVKLDSLSKVAAAVITFLLIIFFWAGRMDEIRVAQPMPPAQEEVVPVYTQPSDEEIDYDEFMNRLPLRKPEPKPPAFDWLSKKGQDRNVG